ncbi:hypothetical protein [Clostridium sp.]|uniref:hypothetical protein n=1 Tax=Clostridium sp. TaxID=1506 RepID=UPI001DF28958|nr:hypothetical protein [Clostridium sp.]MBS5937894.1 hypothetical protein [Clostridium sp.]
MSIINRRVVVIIMLVMINITFNGCSRYTKASYSDIEEGVSYLDGVNAVDYSIIGLEDIKEDVMSGKKGATEYYLSSLKFISTYMATQDETYLKYAKEGAEYIWENTSEIGLVDFYKSDNICSAVDQATMVNMISYIASVDDSYKDLMIELSDGIVNNFINEDNSLVWSKVNSITGEPIKDDEYGYESQFSNSVLKSAQALLIAYKFSPENTKYKEKALDILNSIWERRDSETNLISESWDVRYDTSGSRLYPYSDFRYDDMGGVYIRTLMLAYNLTYDDNIMDILKVYTPALVNGIWDESINGGGFRYLNTTKGETSSVPMLETMHGLFTATLIEASKVIDNKEILNKCIENADNILISGFGVKNNMIPHALDNSGNYLNIRSDSQLGYAIIQFPLGYNMLSNVTGNEEYRNISDEIIETFLERHKSDREGIPVGYMDKIETIEPYGLEENYSKSHWMSQITYLPSYLLYNSIQIEGDVKINWEFNQEPKVLGLVDDIPIWDTNLVSMDLKNKTLKLEEVTGQGVINLDSIGLGEISKVYIDGKRYRKFDNAEIKIKKGTHSYEIKWR